MRVNVRPELLVWARERARIEPSELAGRFPKLTAWESGEVQPTLKQLEGFAAATHTSLAFLLLPTPPSEPVPIPDFRTIADRPIGRPSADLLDTIYSCQQRQSWYRDFARVNREDPVEFVGSAKVSDNVASVALAMRTTLRFQISERGRSWSEALEVLRDRAEELGVLVMINGIVGSNTHRKLDPDEFRGFALSDALAPVIFVNGSDTKAAQIFTLAHELAHLCIGESALSDADLGATPVAGIETWCNRVAAEFLVPAASLKEEIVTLPSLTSDLDRLAARYRVSTLVVLRRLSDIGVLDRKTFRVEFNRELQRVLEIGRQRGGSGGNFYNSTPIRVSKRFARALIANTQEGQTLYRDAVRLLGFKKLSTLDDLGRHLGVL